MNMMPIYNPNIFCILFYVFASLKHFIFNEGLYISPPYLKETLKIQFDPEGIFLKYSL